MAWLPEAAIPATEGSTFPPPGACLLPPANELRDLVSVHRFYVAVLEGNLGYRIRVPQEVTPEQPSADQAKDVLSAFLRWLGMWIRFYGTDRNAGPIPASQLPAETLSTFQGVHPRGSDTATALFAAPGPKYVMYNYDLATPNTASHVTAQTTGALGYMDYSEVKKYAAPMYAPTAAGAKAARLVRASEKITISSPNLAITSANRCDGEARCLVEMLTAASANIALATRAPRMQPAICAGM